MRVSDARTEWNGLVVHKDEWESRHPQDMIRVRKERTAPRGPVRPEPRAVSGTPVCWGKRNAQAGIALVGCAVAGWPITDDDTTVPVGTFTNSL